jgi:hypothetical protein
LTDGILGLACGKNLLMRQQLARRKPMRIRRREEKLEVLVFDLWADEERWEALGLALEGGEEASATVRIVMRGAALDFFDAVALRRMAKAAALTAAPLWRALARSTRALSNWCVTACRWLSTGWIEYEHDGCRPPDELSPT